MLLLLAISLGVSKNFIHIKMMFERWRESRMSFAERAQRTRDKFLLLTSDQSTNTEKQIENKPVKANSNVTFDFTRLLFLLNEVNAIIRLGGDFNPEECAEKNHLSWLCSELSKEKQCFADYLISCKKISNFDNASSKKHNAYLYYRRAINSSLNKINLMLIKN